MSEERRYKTLHDEGIREAVVDSANYVEHVSSITREDLHRKMDFAAELAYRDITIEQQQSELSLMRERVRELQSVLVELGGETDPCFCHHKIGHPLCPGHSASCQKARQLLSTWRDEG